MNLFAKLKEITLVSQTAYFFWDNDEAIVPPAFFITLISLLQNAAFVLLLFGVFHPILFYLATTSIFSFAFTISVAVGGFYSGFGCKPRAGGVFEKFRLSLEVSLISIVLWTLSIAVVQFATAAIACAHSFSVGPSSSCIAYDLQAIYNITPTLIFSLIFAPPAALAGAFAALIYARVRGGKAEKVGKSVAAKARSKRPLVRKNSRGKKNHSAKKK